MAAPEVEPYVPASRTDMPELTLRAILLGLVLSLVMCSANAYVGLYAGITVSAAIPASVISMAVLRGIFRRGTILENNVVQTVASSGESLAAGIIFTVPAIVLLGLWDTFHFWETTLIAMAGGVMGVVMMIPLRRPMIVEQPELKFPEGVACAEVLKAGDRGGAAMKGIFAALGVGALFKGLVSVVGLFKPTVEWARSVGSTVFYGGTDVSPMLVAVGFIVGWDVSFLIFFGGAISFLGAIPILAWGADLGGGSALDLAWTIWDERIRFFGIGAMIVAGIASIVRIAPSMGTALRVAMRGAQAGSEGEALPRTEQNIAGRWLALLVAVTLLLSAVVYWIMTQSVLATIVTTIALFVLAFFFVAVASYIVGLVGSSNSPVSGMTICATLVTAGLLLMLGFTGPAGMLATLGVAGVVCCAACTSGDICQDLKIGQILGATPRALQIGELFGTVAASFILAPTMILLHKAYGIGAPVREGVPFLRAPQGVMFEKLVGGLFGHAEAIPWDLVAWGAGIGVLAIVIDRLFLAPRNSRFRLHAMPLAVGMYLPWTATVPIMIGGGLYLLVERRSLARGDDPATHEAVIHRGLLYSSGLVAGEAIMGIVIAGLVVANLPLPLLPDWQGGGLLVDLVSLAALGGIMAILARVALHGRGDVG